MGGSARVSIDSCLYDISTDLLLMVQSAGCLLAIILDVLLEPELYVSKQNSSVFLESSILT